MLCASVSGCSERKTTNTGGEPHVESTKNSPTETDETSDITTDDIPGTTHQDTSDSETTNTAVSDNRTSSVPDTEIQPEDCADTDNEDKAVTPPLIENAPETTSAPESKDTSPYADETIKEEVSSPSFAEKRIKTRSVPDFGYLLYTPSDPEDNMPLIVYLHGGSGKGNDLSLITEADGFPAYLKNGDLGDVRAYVLIPQLPSDMKGWSDVVPALASLIKVTVADCGIDQSRISLTGHSMGGTGVWNVAAALPDTFSRIAPLSGSVRVTPEAVEILKDIPVRAFAGGADTIVPPESSEDMVAALKDAGGDAEITVFPDTDHFSVPSLTYTNNDIGLVDWLTWK